MLIKCETKSNRVKGLSFHPKLSWILASLHNGVIQLWDYRIGSLIDRFEDHEGPVRGVDFHPSQPLFASGGDDSRVKVWNYRQRRCIFTLQGHLDYVRTVYFHNEYPWILSASDDQTVRIWNWQSRSCLSVLTGHGHYVMSAQFHPTQDLVVSASLDHTIRVWDVSVLREKTVSLSSGGAAGSSSSGSMIPSQQGAADMFGASDAVCKFILEGHDSGVNWATFHATAPLIASGADDKHIKLWRFNDTKAWDVETFKGHFNNVSCVMFHPTRDLLLSNSEDRTIRVWDVTKRAAVHTFRREGDRCWILTCLKKSNLLAVGHDSGMVVFKLDRERPPHDCEGQNLFMVREKWLTIHDLNSDASTSVIATRRPQNPMIFGPRQLLFNPFSPNEMNILLSFSGSDQTSPSYDLVTAPDIRTASSNPGSVTTKTGNGLSVAFIARNRFAVLESPSALCIYNLANELSKRVELPLVADKICAASTNRVLLKSEERVLMYDISNRKVLSELTCPGGMRHAVWSRDGQHVALISKHNVLIANSRLEYLTSLHENIRMKSACWDDCGALVYSTLSHVKYCLTNGDHGIIHSLPQPVYIFRVAKQKMSFLDRQGNLRTQPLNTTEMLFKLALQRKNFDQVALYIKNGRLCGNAVIGFLKRKGYPEVAMQFVSDPKTRFNLALEYGHIDEAVAAAQTINDKATWARLGTEALRQGNHFVVETVLKKIKSFGKLSFLYLITGNFVNLRKMMKIHQQQKDIAARFHNSLMTGDVEERLKVMAEVGQQPLAVMTAKIHRLDEYLAALEEHSENVNFETNKTPKKQPSLFVPPLPVFRHLGKDQSNNWPTIATAENVFTNAMLAASDLSQEAVSMSIAQGVEAISAKDASPGGFRQPADYLAAGDLGLGDVAEGAAAPGTSWGGFDDAFDDTDISPRIEERIAEISGASDSVARGETPESRWLKVQPMAADLVAAGRFDEALATLRRRIGLINAEPLRVPFLRAYQAARAFLPGLPHTPPIVIPLLVGPNALTSPTLTPMRLYTLPTLVEMMRAAQADVTSGSFNSALPRLKETLQCLPLAVASTPDEETSLRELLDICRSYVTAMRLECTRMALPENDESQARSIELAAYFAFCKMPAHQYLVLRRSIGITNRGENYITTATLCRRLIESKSTMRASEDELKKAKMVLVKAEQKGTDKHVIDFDPTDKDNRLCVVSLKRLPRTEAATECPFCNSVAAAQHAGKLCPTCDLCEFGARVIGLRFSPVA